MRSTEGFSSTTNYSPPAVRTKQKCNINYKKVSNKDILCICSACFITREFLDSYYNNTVLIRDTDKLVHVYKVEN